MAKEGSEQLQIDGNKQPGKATRFFVQSVTGIQPEQVHEKLMQWRRYAVRKVVIIVITIISTAYLAFMLVVIRSSLHDYNVLIQKQNLELAELRLEVEELKSRPFAAPPIPFSLADPSATASF